MTTTSCSIDAGHSRDDDAAPPPLSCLADQMHAVQLANSIIGTAGLKEGELRAAAVTDDQGHSTVSSSNNAVAVAAMATNKQPKAFKKAFLDAKPRDNNKNSSSRKPTNNSSSKAGQQIPLLKAQPQQQLGSKPIPDFLRVPPDEQEQRLGVMKTQLLSALQPTPDTISAVAEDATLMSGFDDPDVMAAVAEVARDPKAFAKHAKNPKVQQFYSAMGNLVGSKLEKMDAGAGAVK